MLLIKERRTPDATAPTKLDLPRVRPDDPAAAAVQAALGTGLFWLRRNQPLACQGVEEGVHHLRTTTRRLRSALDVFRPLTDPDWVDRFADELKWLADVLGEVRDLDVLTARLQSAAAELKLNPSLVPLFESLRERHEQASSALRAALASQRYVELEHTLVIAVGTIPLTDDAWRPCRAALPPLVAETWSRLKHAGRALKPDDPDEAFHDVRKRAKRARYAAEAVREALDARRGDGSRRFIRRAKRVQEVLGAHQDAVVAAAEIARVAHAHPSLGPFNFAAGLLCARERADADASRARFFAVWPELDRKKATRWLYS